MGMPPHITLLYPFLKMNEYTQESHDKLSDIISKIRPFSINIKGIGRFPNVLYMTAEPKETIISIIQSLVQAFPDYLPYAGEFPINELTPHLTIASDSSEKKLDFIEKEFIKEIGEINIENMSVEKISFSVRTAGQWRQLCSFQLENISV